MKKRFGEIEIGSDFIYAGQTLIKLDDYNAITKVSRGKQTFLFSKGNIVQVEVPEDEISYVSFHQDGSTEKTKFVSVQNPFACQIDPRYDLNISSEVNPEYLKYKQAEVEKNEKNDKKFEQQGMIDMQTIEGEFRPKPFSDGYEDVRKIGLKFEQQNGAWTAFISFNETVIKTTEIWDLNSWVLNVPAFRINNTIYLTSYFSYINDCVYFYINGIKQKQYTSITPKELETTELTIVFT